MTRINVIPVEELSDQWLLAEYHELPRCIKQDINTKKAPPHYKLGSGHMKWAKKHSLFLFERYNKLCMEMKYRGFTVNYPYIKFWQEYIDTIKSDNRNNYLVSVLDIEINKSRLIEKYKLNPSYYKWTKRDKPYWIKIIDNPNLKDSKIVQLKNNPTFITVDKCKFWKPVELPKEFGITITKNIETIIFTQEGIRKIKLPVNKFFDFLEEVFGETSDT